MRFDLRPLAPGDEHALFPGFSDEETMRYWSCGPFPDVDALRDWLFDRDWTGRTWVAVPHAGGEPVMRMVATEEGAEVSEIGYLVLPGHTRQGIARECLAALLTQLFVAEKVHRVFADVDPRNPASNGLMRSLGFTCEARLRDTLRTHIGWCDSFIWGMLEDEWDPARGAGR